ncbi:hypothetical protein [Dongia sp.]|uniref:hypothetical protein n=1 Tax=Dongia sp. TaxID=1977262 RepID=UPI0035AECEB3
MTRAELYALVWETPMIRLAKSFGLSDVGLRKICVKHDVPTPPLGYWAKLAHGKKVRQPALPPLRDDIEDQIDLSGRTPKVMPAPVAAAHEAAVAAEARPERKIQVPTARPAKLHSVAAAVGQALRKARPDSSGLVTFVGGYWPPIQIGPSSIERVEILLDTLASALVQRSNALTMDGNTIHVVIEEIPFELRVYETKSKMLHTPTKDELVQQSRYNDDHQRMPEVYSADRKAWPTYDYYPSGRLALELTDPSQYRYNNVNLVGRWYDRTSKSLGEALGEVMIALITAAAAVKVRRAEEMERARLKAEEDERRRKDEARRERVKKRQKFLISLAAEYVEYRKLAEFAPVIVGASVESGAEPVDRMGRVLREMVSEMGNRFGREGLNAEIDRQGLFGEGDPV